MGRSRRNDDTEIYYEYEKRKGKALPIFIVIVAVLSVCAFFYFFKDDILNDIQDETKIKMKDSETIVKKDFVTGLRMASLDRYDEAISYFEKLDFNQLSESDRQIVLDTYVQAGEAQKALDLEESYDQEIIEYYAENDELEKLNELVSDSQLIEFEIAILDNDYRKIIELKDINGLEMNERRANAIANAYYQLDEKEEAVNFTSLMVFDGINMWNMETKVNNKPSSIKKSEETTSSGGFINILFLLIVLLGLGVLGYLGYQNKDKLFVKPKKKKKKRARKSRKKDKNTEAKDVMEEVEDETENTNKEKTEDDKYSYYFDDDDF